MGEGCWGKKGAGDAWGGAKVREGVGEAQNPHHQEMLRRGDTARSQGAGWG